MQTKSTLKVDTEWFKSRIQAVGRSQADIARRLGTDPSALSLMLSGSERRKWHLHHVRDLAPLLNVSFYEILSRLGIDAIAERPSQPVPLLGSIDVDGVVTTAPANRSIPGPSGGQVNAAYRFEFAPGVPCTVYADAPRPAKECIGQLCIVPSKNGSKTVRRVQRGLVDGSFDLAPLRPGGESETDVTLDTAIPLAWVRL